MTQLRVALHTLALTLAAVTAYPPAVAHAWDAAPEPAADTPTTSTDRPRGPTRRRPDPPRRLRDTAFTLEGGDFSIGLFDLEVGILDELTIGTYVAPWLLFPVLDTPIPTAFIKVRDWFDLPVNFSLRAAMLYIPSAALSKLGPEGEINAAAINLPIEVAASLELGPRFTQSAALTYVLTQVGANRASTTSIAGALTASQLTLSAMSELRLTRGFSITLLARVLIARSNLRARVLASQGSTEIDADVGLTTNYGHMVACIVPGLALRGSHINFEFGLGYGSWWLPIVDLPLPFAGVVPDMNFYVVF